MFHLDGKPGTFHTLPNGEACGLDQSAVVGDYKAWSEFGTVELWYWALISLAKCNCRLYRWPRCSNENCCYLLRVLLSPCAFDASVLRISWTLEEALISAQNLNALQVEERMVAWDDMEHRVVLQVDTVYARVSSVE